MSHDYLHYACQSKPARWLRSTGIMQDLGTVEYDEGGAKCRADGPSKIFRLEHGVDSVIG